MNPSLTQPLAEFAAGVRFGNLPTEVVTMARYVLLDALGCALGAHKEDPRKAGIALALTQQFGSSPLATVIGGQRAHPALAALANGMLINAADNDDTHKRALIHTGSVVVPAALAVCQAENLDGRRLVEALVAGYEVAVRVGMAVMPSHYRFWHSTATNGTFGAATAAACAYGLDAGQILTALGNAGTQAAGLNTFFESGDDTKSLHPGKAAMNGILSALLARLGASSPPDILGHAKGYLAAFSTEPRPAALNSGLGNAWEILNNGFKPYPSILASHSPIGATLELVSQQSVDATQVRSVQVQTYATVKSHFSSKDITTSMAARLSVPYCVAAAIVDRTIGQAQFRPERFNDPVIRELLQKVEVEVDPELSPLYPEKFPARVVITLKNGERREALFLYPLGDPQNPLSEKALTDKFLANCDGVITDSRAQQIIETAFSIEHHRVSDLACLLDTDGVQRHV